MSVVFYCTKFYYELTAVGPRGIPEVVVFSLRHLEARLAYDMTILLQSANVPMCARPIENRHFSATRNDLAYVSESCLLSSI